MALLPLGLFFITILWAYGFMLMEGASKLNGMITISCYILPIPILALPLEYVTETSGVVTAATLSLSTTTLSQWMLIDVFFLFMALLNMWMIVTGHKKKRDD
jgi:hypothetical protein